MPKTRWKRSHVAVYLVGSMTCSWICANLAFFGHLTAAIFHPSQTPRVHGLFTSTHYTRSTKSTVESALCDECWGFVDYSFGWILSRSLIRHRDNFRGSTRTHFFILGRIILKTSLQMQYRIGLHLLLLMQWSARSLRYLLNYLSHLTPHMSY